MGSVTAGRDALRAALAEALAEKRRSWNVDELREIVADLLPHAERFAAEQVAAALRAAAKEQRDEAENVPRDDEGTHADGHRCAAYFLDLRARAAAVLAAPDNGGRA